LTWTCCACLACRGTGDLFGTKQSGRPRDISATTWALLQEQPQLLEAARGAAAQLLVEGGVSPALRGALLAYGYWGTSSNRGRFGMLGA
jgi:RecG-like helicase